MIYICGLHDIFLLQFRHVNAKYNLQTFEENFNLFHLQPIL